MTGWPLLAAVVVVVVGVTAIVWRALYLSAAWPLGAATDQPDATTDRRVSVGES